MDFSGAINNIILLILGVSTIRWVVAKIGIVPRYKKFSFLVYDEYDSTVAYKLLEDIGFPVNETKNNISKFRLVKDINALDKLLCVCINNITKSDDMNYYGHKTVVPTHYYIDTMGAAHNKDELEIMAKAILDLCGKRCRQMPDFIITPKSGNPYLSYEIARQDSRIKTILIKSPHEGSFLRNRDEESMYINNEGVYQLINQFTNSKKERKLYGVAVDCNISGGTNLREAMEHFNETVCKKYNGHIESVKDAVVLFHVDTTIDINKAFNDVGMNIFRYFDLTDEIKEKLFKISKKAKHHIIYNDKKYLAGIVDIKAVLLNNGLLKEGT
ncbi:hypothetical protein FACS1894172_18040 [Spirochaetia bacterium]|nr:hypothetical protein FACS1894172_18040 [Spirochaetia bacterium]